MMHMHRFKHSQRLTEATRNGSSNNISGQEGGGFPLRAPPCRLPIETSARGGRGGMNGDPGEVSPRLSPIRLEDCLASLLVG